MWQSKSEGGSDAAARIFLLNAAVLIVPARGSGTSKFVETR